MTDQNKMQLPAVTGESFEAEEIIRRRPYEEDGIVYYRPKKFERCSIKSSKTKDFRNADLVSVSGKSGLFDGFDFRYADMQDCYFHEAQFENCNFTGAKIRRCNFRTATFRNCRFEYITIDETPID